jgi:hypothetical protein
VHLVAAVPAVNLLDPHSLLADLGALGVLERYGTAKAIVPASRARAVAAPPRAGETG